MDYLSLCARMHEVRYLLDRKTRFKQFYPVYVPNFDQKSPSGELSTWRTLFEQTEPWPMAVTTRVQCTMHHF